MKTYRALYRQMSTFEALYRAYQLCRQGKGYRDYAVEFAQNLEENLFDLRDEIVSETWAPEGYETFYVSDPKRRLINAPTFRDRIVHRAVYDALAPIWERRFIYDSYACRKEKGTHAAVDRLTRFMRTYPQGEGYALQLDVKSYFASIDHEVLIGLIDHRVKDRQFLRLVRLIVESYADAPGVGVPLGNLTSQLFANVYLNELDQFAKHTLRCRHYLRYMDDVTILNPDKRQLWAWNDQIESFLGERLRLRLHPRKQSVSPLDCGVDFLGYRVYRDHRRVRSRNIHRIYRNLDQMERGTFRRDPRSSISSWAGYAKHADTYRLNCQIARRHPFLLVAFTPIEFEGAAP